MIEALKAKDPSIEYAKIATDVLRGEPDGENAVEVEHYGLLRRLIIQDGRPYISRMSRDKEGKPYVVGVVEDLEDFSNRRDMTYNKDEGWVEFEADNGKELCRLRLTAEGKITKTFDGLSPYWRS